MEWDLAVFPQPVTEALIFNQLLDKLRSMHERICARNAQLELHFHDLGLLKSKAEDAPLQKESFLSWHPCTDIADPSMLKQDPALLKQGAILTDPPILNQGEARVSAGAARLQESPRRAGNSTVSALSTTDLAQSLDRLVKQQEQLSDQFAQMFQAETLYSEHVEDHSRRESRQSSVRKPSVENPGRLSRMSSGSTEDEDSMMKAESRFAVPTGTTKDFGAKVWSAMSDHHFRNWRLFLRHILNGTLFNILTSILILSYAGLIAVETDLIARDPDMNSTTIKTMHYVYTGIFSGELLIRFIAFGQSVFFGSDGFWNKLDLFFVVSAIGEIIMENAIGSVSTAGSVVRAVRIGRIVRTVRLVRTFRQFHEFQKMAYALLSSMKTLICSLALLIFVMFFFAVWLTQTAADVEMREQIQDLELRYGDLMSTTYTLFLSVSNGISWDLCYMPLHHLSWLSAQAFIFYVSITLFGVLNVVTSIFVEGVIRSVQRSRDLIVQEKEENKRIAMTHVKEVFRHMDSDGSGQISTDELEHFLEDPELRKYVEALDIEAEDTRLLFRLLDRDSSGVISADEFCDGCLRLKGNAKSIDVHALIFQIKAFLDKWGEFTGFCEDSFHQIRRNLKRESSMGEKGTNGSLRLKSGVSNRSTLQAPRSSRNDIDCRSTVVRASSDLSYGVNPVDGS